MINLAGYTIKEEIHTGEKSIVCRGDKAGKPVIIKILHNEYPDSNELTSFKHEYDVLEKINSPGIVRAVGLEKYKNSLAIIFEDIGGDSLSKLFQDIKSYSLTELLNIMLMSVKALGEVHNLKLVHKDIKPHNIILNKSAGVLKIIDFGNASLLEKQSSYTPLNSSLEGTLAYISPEQTGRMNRTVDYRTDYYSLGVTFYQLLTGELPFITSDPMELVHAHIAKTPVSPFEKNKTPKVISDIVMKLLQKNPEDRYQSTAGLVYDLEWCASATLSNRSLEEMRSLSGVEMQIGQNDFSSKFQIPEKLYGRTKEVIQILKAFKIVAEGNVELLLISGRSGIGKSILINEINKPIVEYKGYFASGKYDQFKRTIPYRAITYALQNLIQQILTESSDSISTWKANLLNALGANGKIITDVIPELETLIGEQPPVNELGLTESQNRFNSVFQNFVKAFCKKEHPIAIFLDDLQWADTPSILLIQTILSDPEMKYLFLMLSFRNNEVLPTDPFSVMLEDLHKTGLQFKNIVLEPISVTDISRLVGDTLNCEDVNAKELATVLFEKTKGNPFFVNELFKSFYEKELIQYVNGSWNWDIVKIQDVKLSENVIDLMVEKVKELSDSAIEKLKLAACIGSWFKQEVFFNILGKSESEAKHDLIHLANEGFLRLGEIDVNFVHDKIREATYTLISDTERSKYHYTIGNTYLSMLEKYRLEDHIFTIVNQLNQGIEHIVNPEEKAKLQELNILAGNKAMASAAYEAALGFFQIAINQLPASSWETNYDLTLELYTNRARSEYLSKEYAAAEKTFDLILAKARNPIDKITIYELKSSIYVSQNKIIEAIDILKQALKDLGVQLPKKPTEVSPLPEIIKFKLKFGKRKAKDLLNLPTMTDLKSLAIMRLLNASIAPAFIGQPNLFPVIVLKMVNHSLSKGNASLTPFAYSAFGIILGSGLGDFQTGEDFGNLAIELIRLLGDKTKPIECRSVFLVTNMVNHWRHHAKLGEPLFLQAIESGRESGDLQYTSYALNNFHFQKILMRQNLLDVSGSFKKYETFFVKLKQYNAEQLYQLNRQIISNFMGEAENILLLNGNYFDETKVLTEWIDSNNANALFDFYLSKSRLEYFFGDLNKAFEYSSLAAPYEAAMFGMMFVPELVFFDSLICAKLFLKTADKKKQKEYRKRLDKNYKRMKKWGENCEANYGHKFHIIQGLIEQIENKTDKALASFERAIHLAKQYEYTLEEAIANEFMAEIWTERGKDRYAEMHLIDAHYAYKKWGSEPKVKQLEEKYPQLKRQINRGNSTYTSISSSKSSTEMGTASNFLDLNTVVKASQTISGEIQLGKLLEKMMKILFENAGAERGFFILKDKGKWLIEAEGNANTETIEVLQAKPLEGYSELAPNIVNYVIRTKSIILLNDATKKGLFVNDVYVKAKSPKSILCYPVINQGNLIGVVYLENNLTTDAFTPDRVEILKILSSQIAVSVENSLLYANLEEKVEERTRDLNQALVEVRGLKEQQDGDYFLNTLLIEPLGQNNAFSKTVGIDFFIKQKKNFIFRKREYELGGDINISENIELQGKKYIVFLNGDAMGKSIQGAGGVLVLGTVFKSIIQRTISTASGKNVYPERWLKNAFIEMHKAFESFDGSMLMSTVFGLIDEKTGTMYFMNAEHPDMVLYRDGVASFIENPNQYRKLGTQGQSGNISVEVFSLRPDDVVILGSDGRDDIILGKDPATGSDIINQDEFLFLAHVKKADGDLEMIYEEIKNAGKQMDDLSLFKIHYKGVVLEQSKMNEDLKLLEDYKEKMEFAKYTEVGEKVISNYPHLTNFLYEMSYACKELGQYEKAIDYGERLRLRDAKNVSNLLNLIESYNGIGKKERAKTILDACIKARPDDVRFKNLKEELSK
jgi:predicted ATPase/tRNA A-37 threonylcarbamoyl transferase component Bud32/exonuclease VII small subunit